MTKESAKYPSRINEKDEVDVILSPSGWNWTSHANEISLMFFLFVAFSCHCFYYDLKFICFLLLSTFLLLFSPLALVPNYHSKLHVYACLSLSPGTSRFVGDMHFMDIPLQSTFRFPSIRMCDFGFICWLSRVSKWVSEWWSWGQKRKHKSMPKNGWTAKRLKYGNFLLSHTRAIKRNAYGERKSNSNENGKQINDL